MNICNFRNSEDFINYCKFITIINYCPHNHMVMGTNMNFSSSGLMCKIGLIIILYANFSLSHYKNKYDWSL